MSTTNAIERVNQELQRRTRVAALFPNEASLLRLTTALLCEQSDEWSTGKIYLNMNPPRDHRRAGFGVPVEHRQNLPQHEPR